MAKTYILVHGAWLGAWCWDLVVPMLEAKGHRVLALDLPAHGTNEAPISAQNMDSYTEYVEGVLRAQSEKVILVGHSMGGMSISQAASRVPEKVEKLVYVTAFLPRSGQSADGLDNGIKPTPWREMSRQGIAVKMDETETVSELLPEAAKELLYNDMEGEQVELWLKKFGKENINAQYQAVELSEAFDAIPKYYVRCSKDTITLPEVQDKMLAATPCEKIFTVDSGHSPYHSKPRELADILLSL